MWGGLKYENKPLRIRWYLSDSLSTTLFFAHTIPGYPPADDYYSDRRRRVTILRQKPQSTSQGSSPSLGLPSTVSMTMKRTFRARE